MLRFSLRVIQNGFDPFCPVTHRDQDMNALPLIHGLSRAQLAEVCRELDQPAYRARQIWDWLYQRF